MIKKKIIAPVITLILLAVIVYKINWSQMLVTFLSFDFKFLWAIILLYILTLYIRGVRWKVLLLNEPKYSALFLGKVFTAGSLLNVFLPARAGDIYRACYLGSVKNEKKMKVFGSIILERIFDGISVFLILFAAMFLYCKQDWIVNLTYCVGLLFLGSILFFYIVFKTDKIFQVKDSLIKLTSCLPENCQGKACDFITKTCSYADSFMCGFEILNDFNLCLQTLFYSFLIWGIEAYIVFLILYSFNMELGFAASLFVISLTSFSTMIPSTSMFLGPYQVAYIMALGIFGVSKSATLAVSTVHQGILTLILLVVGGYYLLRFNIPVKDLTKSDK